MMLATASEAELLAELEKRRPRRLRMTQVFALGALIVSKVLGMAGIACTILSWKNHALHHVATGLLWAAMGGVVITVGIALYDQTRAP